MKYTSIFFLSFLFLVVGCKTVKPKTSKTYNTVTVKRDIEILSADEMEGRETGTQGEKKAAAYISTRMKQIGLLPGGIGDGYIQTFNKTLKSNPHADMPSTDDEVITGRNILGLIDNKSRYTAVIGAHYDHLGYGKEGSLYVGEPAIHNGADDNASGVAGMLRIAEALTMSQDSSLNITTNPRMMHISSIIKG